MLRRLKDAILPRRRDKDKDEERLQEKASQVQTWLKPVFSNWNLVSEILTWKTPVLSCTVFYLISGLFWSFLLPIYQRIVLAVGVVLLVLAVHKDTRYLVWSSLERWFDLKIKEENRFEKTPEDVSKTIAAALCGFENYINFTRDLRHRSSSKFYCLVAVNVSAFLAIWSYVPVIRVLYLTVCACYFYPSLRYYGVLDKMTQKIVKLTEPVVTHWEYNLTKRQRDAIKGRSYSFDTESEDEFALEKSKYTKKVLSSALPASDSAAQGNISNPFNKSSAAVDTQGTASGPIQDDFTDDDEFHPSEFVSGLEMPSLSQLDSLMEPYEEFHYGLQFPDPNYSLTEGLNVEHRTAYDTGEQTDDDVEDIPIEETVDFAGQSNEAICHDTGVVRRRKGVGMPRLLETNTETSHCDPERNLVESPKGMEKDFEFLDHSELDEPIRTESPANNSQSERYLKGVVSYSQAGISQVSKWLGY